MSTPPGPDDEEERTVVRPRISRAQRNSGPPAAEPVAGPAAAQSSHTLHIGCRVRDHEITGLIGEGGFGIVYLAWDHSLQRKVAIKEYMPASMVSRLAGSSAIAVKSERHAEPFRAGLKSFLNEARLLARFDHPSLVKVYRFWEENGTAYMVMPFYEGPTLKSALAGLGHSPGEADLRSWLGPILDALEVMHRAQCFHRDIAPDNILLTPSGPLLLDFGAARRVIGDMTHALTVVLKPGYAPIEQYGDVATMAQGAWTDLYALASVVYYAITGHTPTSSVERLMDDRLEPLSVLMAGRYSPAFLAAVDAALAVRPQDRPQSVDAFVRLLGGGRGDGAAAPATPASYVSDSRFELGHSTLPNTLMPELPTELRLRPGGDAPASEVGSGPSPGSAHGRPGEGVPIPYEPDGRAAAAPVPGGRPQPARRRLFVAAAAAGGLASIAVAVLAFRWASPAPPPSALPALPALPAALEPRREPAPAPAAAGFAAVPAPLPVAAPPLASPLPTASSAVTNRRASAARRDGSNGRTDAAPAEPRSRAGSRCGDILQKASLEPLTGDEAAYLKRECR